MNIRRVVPDIMTERLDESRDFYVDLLGFKVAMDMGWIVTLVSTSNPTAQINLGRRDPSSGPSGPLNTIGISIEVENVDEVHAKAVARGATISYPLTDEPWGVRRFFMLDPNGVTLNIMCHRQAFPMNPSLRVFLCSTYLDLTKEREAVLDAINRLRFHHHSMEVFGADSNRPIEVCLREVRQSDVLVVIVAHRYGSLVPARDISFTEAEYSEAHLLGKPCLVYMRSHDVRVLPTDIERDPENIGRLEKFKITLRDRHAVASFKQDSDLAVQVVVDLVRTAEAVKTGVFIPLTLPSSDPLLDARQLVLSQDSTLDEVWVYAPHPLETMSTGAHNALRKRVFTNLMEGVKYCYFVESEAGIDRIRDLLRLMADENGGDSPTFKRLEKQTMVVVLAPAYFLTYFTVHHRKKGDTEVFQSVVTPDRNDVMTRLSRDRAIVVRDLIARQIEMANESNDDGLRVFRLHNSKPLTS